MGLPLSSRDTLTVFRLVNGAPDAGRAVAGLLTPLTGVALTMAAPETTHEFYCALGADIQKNDRCEHTDGGETHVYFVETIERHRHAIPHQRATLKRQGG